MSDDLKEALLIAGIGILIFCAAYLYFSRDTVTVTVPEPYIDTSGIIAEANQILRDAS